MSLTCPHLDQAYAILLDADDGLNHGEDISYSDVAYNLQKCIPVGRESEDAITRAREVMYEIPCSKCGLHWESNQSQCECGSYSVLIDAERVLLLVRKAKKIIEGKANEVYRERLAKLREAS